MQRYTVNLYQETALHVSGGTSTHHQERIQLYLQHLVFVTPLLLSVAIVEELEPVWVCCGWRTPDFQKILHIKLNEVGAEMSHADGRTDTRTDMTKLIVDFRNFVNTPNKKVPLQVWSVWRRVVEWRYCRHLFLTAPPDGCKWSTLLADSFVPGAHWVGRGWVGLRTGLDVPYSRNFFYLCWKSTIRQSSSLQSPALLLHRIRYRGLRFLWKTKPESNPLLLFFEWSYVISSI
jgi:hypothetical protein